MPHIARGHSSKTFIDPEKRVRNVRVIIAGSPRSRRVPSPPQAPLFQPFAHVVERLMPIQHGEDHGFDPTPTREPMRRVGRNHVVDHCRHLQAPSGAQDQRDMCHRMHLLDGNGHDAPPVVAAPTASEPHTLSGESVALLPEKNRVVYPGPLNVGSRTRWRLYGAGCGVNNIFKCRTRGAP